MRKYVVLLIAESPLTLIFPSGGRREIEDKTVARRYNFTMAPRVNLAEDLPHQS
jgi:hypothetical protein